jgi:CHASE3 domain sensor protein
MTLIGLSARLRIATRIASGFAVTLLLLAILGVLGVFSLESSETSFHTYAKVGDNTIKVAEIDGDFVRLRRHVFIYTSTGDEQELKLGREAAASLKQHIGETVAVMRTEQSAKLDAAGKLLDAYVASFEVAARDRVARDQALAAMNAAGVKARADLSEITKTAMADRDYEAAAIAGQV